MNRDRQRWLVLASCALAAVALELARERGYLPVGFDALIYLVLAVMLIVLSSQIRLGLIPALPGFSAVRAKGPVLFGLALVGISVVWLAGGVAVVGANASYGIIIPFVVLFIGGLMICMGGLVFKLLQLLIGK
jgi:hypothetical protein